MRIPGMTALVTGGSSGLGGATVVALLQAGANVTVVDLSEPKDAVAEAAARHPDRVWFARADVRSEEEIQAAVDGTVERFGGLHIAASCAGIAIAGRTLNREGVPHDLSMFRQVVDINLVGTFNVSRLAAARMSKQEPEDGERGVIVNTASIAAFDGQTGQAAYAASKGGVASLTLVLARDLAPALIRCVTIAPGVFDTPMMAMLPQPARQALAEDIPHPRRFGDPSEYAAMVRHIVENPMLNGTTIRLDGALRMPFR